MRVVLGIDVGGTSIKAGMFTEKGELLVTRTFPTPALITKEAFDLVKDELIKMLFSIDATPHDVIAVGVDIPGPVADDGSVGFFANLELDPDGFIQTLSSAFPFASLAFVNDANAAALGEMWAGAARGVTSFVLIALGTGVGAGVVCNSRLVAGAFGAGGEMGHMHVKDGEKNVCGCGRHGCLEQYASATGIVRLYREECERRGVAGVEIKHDTDTLSIFQALDQGDECADLAIQEMCRYLGGAMAQVSTIIDPKLFLIGGGVAGSFATFAPHLRKAFTDAALKTSRDARIEAASLGNQAAMYGCAYEALRIYKSRVDD